MTTPQDEVGVRLHFYSRPLSDWSDDNRRVMLRKIRALFRRRRQKPRRRKVAK
jgi:hypothetical protein